MFDIAVIGGGPAGMIAAGSAAQAGNRVVLLEKNDRLGLKLLLTGGGRCNLTNVSHGVREMAAQYGGNGRFFISALTRFSPADTVAFFNGLGLATEVENHGRVFPAGGKALGVLDALTQYMIRNGVEIRAGSAVKRIVAHQGRIGKVALADDSEVSARNYIMATGGMSYPSTGSTGDGFRWLKELGHTVVPHAPALSAIITLGGTAASLQGLSLREVTVTVFRDGAMITRATGDVLFTADGLSGPAVLDVSRDAGRVLPGIVSLGVDLLPQTTREELDPKLVGLLAGNSKKRLRSVLDLLMPARLGQVVMMQCGLDGEKPANAVMREERRKIADRLKNLVFEIERLAPLDKAIVTAGGVDLREVDSKTMRSKLIENLYFAGEILDLDGPTGGYNLQVCWSTGKGVRTIDEL